MILFRPRNPALIRTSRNIGFDQCNTGSLVSSYIFAYISYVSRNSISGSTVSIDHRLPTMLFISLPFLLLVNLFICFLPFIVAPSIHSSRSECIRPLSTNESSSIMWKSCINSYPLLDCTEQSTARFCSPHGDIDFWDGKFISFSLRFKRNIYILSFRVDVWNFLKSFTSFWGQITFDWETNWSPRLLFLEL